MTFTRAGWLGLTTLALAACGGARDDDPVSRQRQATVFGLDQRAEPWELDASWRDLAQSSIAGVVFRSAYVNEWTFCGDAGTARHVGLTVGQRKNLCPTERFADQPSMVSCSATLLDDDLIVTANHCLEPGCAGAAFGFGLFYDAPGQLHPVTMTDVYSCKKILLSNHLDDVAIVQIERPVRPPFRPAPVTRALPAQGDAIVMLGFPTGMPMKASLQCEVKAVVGPGFRHNCDFNAGSSGSGTFTAQGELFGVLSSGPGDYRLTAEGCAINAAYDDDGFLPGIPTAPQLAGSNSILGSIAQLCDAGWPSARLCSRPGRCGDGTCAGTETPATCASDCAAPVCGDGSCALVEEDACAADCSSRPPCPREDAHDAGVEAPPPPPACGCGKTGALVVLAALLVFTRAARQVTANRPLRA